MMMNNEVRASDHCLAQRPVAAANACCCHATDRTRPVFIGPRPVTSVELVSSRFYIRLGSYLRAWTLLDILGLILCFYGLAYGVACGIIMSPLSKSRLAPY